MTDQLQYRIASCGERYRPEFRRSPTERWWFMRKDGKPLDFPTSTAAKAAADHIIDLDEASRSPAHIIEVEPEPLGSFEDWRRDKDAELKAEKDRIFGSAALRIIRDCKGNQVEVQTKGKAIPSGRRPFTEMKGRVA